MPTSCPPRSRAHRSTAPLSPVPSAADPRPVRPAPRLPPRGRAGPPGRRNLPFSPETGQPRQRIAVKKRNGVRERINGFSEEQGWGGTYRAPGSKKKLCWPTDFDCCVAGCVVDGGTSRLASVRVNRPKARAESPRWPARETGWIRTECERAKQARVAVRGGRITQTPAAKRGTKLRTKRRKKRRKKEGKESVGVGGVLWRRFRSSTEEMGRGSRGGDAPGAHASSPARGTRENTARTRRAAVRDGEAEDEAGQGKPVV